MIQQKHIEQAWKLNVKHAAKTNFTTTKNKEFSQLNLETGRVPILHFGFRIPKQINWNDGTQDIQNDGFVLPS